MDFNFRMLHSTFRHFGPKDPIPITFLRQAGAESIVTSLHHLPVGAVWPVKEIRQRQSEIADIGLHWSVVESLPVAEAIKTRTSNYPQLLENYQHSLRNLATCGINTVTYNFMPVTDWTRTDLNYQLPDGASAIRFDWTELAMFDIFILQREGAEEDYPAFIREEAYQRFPKLSTIDQRRIIENLIKGLPGSEESFTLSEFREALAVYDGIQTDELRHHLVLFLQAITPVAEEVGIKLVIHPDDPPFSLLGLPRVLSTAADFRYLVEQVPSPANGLCFCTGSFGVRPDNDLPAMVKEFAERIHFIHLRSTQRTKEGHFHEAAHLEGDVPIAEVVSVLLQENAQRETPIPMRPDHGHRMMHELEIDSTLAPGYTSIGRMKGLAELRGLQLGLLASGLS